MDYVKQQIHCLSSRQTGLTGRGIGVAVLDTGAYPHQDFKERITVFKDIIRGRRDAYDDNSHGTHVCGIIGGDGRACGGRFQGMAPECGLICVKVLDKKGNGFASDVLSGLRWVRENRERYGIRIVNISVGSFNRKVMGEDSALVQGVDAAWDDGLVMVVAAGNQGPGSMTITTPGISRKVITVGSSDDYKAYGLLCVQAGHRSSRLKDHQLLQPARAVSGEKRNQHEHALGVRGAGAPSGKIPYDDQRGGKVKDPGEGDGSGAPP